MGKQTKLEECLSTSNLLLPNCRQSHRQTGTKIKPTTPHKGAFVHTQTNRTKIPYFSFFFSFFLSDSHFLSHKHSHIVFTETGKHKFPLMALLLRRAPTAYITPAYNNLSEHQHTRPYALRCHIQLKKTNMNVFGRQFGRV